VQQANDANADVSLDGTIAAVDGPFELIVTLDDGTAYEVQLRPETIVTPAGLAFAVGTPVTIIGTFDDDGVFQARAITAGRAFAGPLPRAVRYGDGWWYPGYPYGYGPEYCVDYDGTQWVQRAFVHSAPTIAHVPMPGGAVPPFVPHRFPIAPITGPGLRGLDGRPIVVQRGGPAAGRSSSGGGRSAAGGGGSRGGEGSHGGGGGGGHSGGGGGGGGSHGH
jgi:hypothetical protein